MNIARLLACLAAVTLAFILGRFSAPNNAGTSLVASRLLAPSLLDSPQAHVGTSINTPEKQPTEASTPTDDDPSLREKLAEIVGAGNLDYQAFSEVINAWVDKDPLGAIAFLAQGETKAEMLRWIVSVWGERDPEAASLWLSENQDRDHADHAIEGLAQGIAKEDPGSALTWAQTIQDPTIKTRVLTSAGYQQFRHDHALAEEALGSSGLPLAAQEAIRETWQSSWRSSAKRNSQNMASVASAARAAGIDFSAAQSAVDVIEILREGVTPESGPFKDTNFGIPNLTTLEGQALIPYLQLKESALSYQNSEN